MVMEQINRRIEYRFVHYHRGEKVLEYRIHPEDYTRKWWQFWRRNRWKRLHNYISGMTHYWSISPPNEWWNPVFKEKSNSLAFWKENYPDTDSLKRYYEEQNDFYNKDLKEYSRLKKYWTSTEY